MHLTRSNCSLLVAAALAVTGCSSSDDDADVNGVNTPTVEAPAENPTDTPVDSSGQDPDVDGGSGVGDPPSDTGAGTEGQNGDQTGGETPDENPSENTGEPPTPPDTTDPEPSSASSCLVIDVINVGTGTQRIDIELQPGESVEITNQPRGTIVGFDATLGEIQYAPPASRAPDLITYNIIDANNSVVAQDELTLRLDPIRIMPLGDSITHGVEVGTGNLDSPPVPQRVGYRQSLLNQLASAGQVVDFTGQGGQVAGFDAGISDPDNNGYPGVDISFINDRVQEIFEELPSDVVLLHIGTNLTPNNASGIDAILDNIDAWEAANFPVTVFVATLIPKRDPSLQQTVDQFNADLRIRIAARLSDNVVLVEQAAAVTVADIDPDDVGVHPTAPGYLRMADTWFDAMASSALFPSCE